MKDRFIVRPAPWWEVVRVSPEGKRVVVATAASEQEARAEANRREEEPVEASSTLDADDDSPRETLNLNSRVEESKMSQPKMPDRAP